MTAKAAPTNRFALRGWRIAFIGYATLLTIGTHWPNLQIDAPVIERPDLLLHVICFGLLAALLLAARFFDAELLSGRNLGWSFAVALAWSGLDELSQGLPYIHRYVVWSDFFANALGVSLVILAAYLWRWKRTSAW
ncbi:MAG: hypothetical protein ACF8NJ_02805 [Phycisphaerales bacterium JB038]